MLCRRYKTVTIYGSRVVVPDLPGFGKSDKFSSRYHYTYEEFVDWMSQWIEGINLENITLFCQDWGGLIGLRLAAKYDDKFKRIVAANTGLPTGKAPLNTGFLVFKDFMNTKEDLHVAGQVRNGSNGLDQSALNAYNGPFPNESYKQGVRQFPNIVPSSPQSYGKKIFSLKFFCTIHIAEVFPAFTRLILYVNRIKISFSIRPVFFL